MQAHGVLVGGTGHSLQLAPVGYNWAGATAVVACPYCAVDPIEAAETARIENQSGDESINHGRRQTVTATVGGKSRFVGWVCFTLERESTHDIC